MNQTCPRILYFDNFGPRTQRNLPCFVPSLFHISHDLLASYDWPAPFIGFPPLFSQVLPGHPLEHLSIGGSIAAPFFPKGTLCGRLEPLFFHRFHSFSLPFVFHNSGIRPPPFFSLLLTTMPHGHRSVTTSLDCVGTPAVAVLCESDCPTSACVVQLERKKKKRVSVIVGNRKVPTF
jgi:hypothetical protein